MSLRTRTLSELWTGFVTILAVTFLVFLTLRVVPGDPIDLMLGESAAVADRQALRTQLGLDKGFALQFIDFSKRLAHGDLGDSISRRQPVSRLVREAFPNTLLLATFAMALAILFGVPAGAYCAYRPGSAIGKTLFLVCTVLSAFPTFWLGPLLTLALGLRWPWLPVASFDQWSSLTLPALTMALGLGAHLAQTTRAALLECLSADFIRTAYAKGASPTRVLFRHALPAAAVAIIVVATLQLGHLLAGAVITETIFDWPGLGKLTYDAILQRDYPTVQAAVLSISVMYVVLNCSADMISARFSPGSRSE